MFSWGKQRIGFDFCLVCIKWAIFNVFMVTRLGNITKERDARRGI